MERESKQAWKLCIKTVVTKNGPLQGLRCLRDVLCGWYTQSQRHLKCAHTPILSPIFQVLFQMTCFLLAVPAVCNLREIQLWPQFCQLTNTYTLTQTHIYTHHNIAQLSTEKQDHPIQHMRNDCLHLWKVWPLKCRHLFLQLFACLEIFEDLLQGLFCFWGIILLLLMQWPGYFSFVNSV